MVSYCEVTRDTLVWGGAPGEFIGLESEWVRADATELAPLFATPRYGESRDTSAVTRVLLSPQRDLDPEDMLFSAPKTRRFIAFLLDALTVASFVVIFSAPAILLLLGEPKSLAIRVFVLTLVSCAIYVTACICLLWSRGQTPGKMIAGIRIVDADGSKTPLWRILILRNGFYILPVFLLGVSSASSRGFIFDFGMLSSDTQLQMCIATGVLFFFDSCLALGKNGRTLHDLVAGTIVVEV